MGLADRLAARTQADVGRPRSRPCPASATHMRPNLELILGLHPDMVLQMGGRKAASEPVEALRRLGIPTAFFEVKSFAGCSRSSSAWACSPPSRAGPRPLPPR